MVGGEILGFEKKVIAVNDDAENVAEVVQHHKKISCALLWTLNLLNLSQSKW